MSTIFEFYFRIRFDLIIVMGMAFCIIQIGQHTANISHHLNFSRVMWNLPAHQIRWDIGILRPLSIFTCSSSSAWRIASACQISSNSVNAWRGGVTSYRFFSRWLSADVLNFRWALLDHPRRTSVGPSLVYKVHWTYSFSDIAILRFWCFALKLPIYVVTHANFGDDRFMDF